MCGQNEQAVRRFGMERRTEYGPDDVDDRTISLRDILLNGDDMMAV
jgi:hypothetical protein